MLPDILTTDEVAALLRCAAATVHERTRAGELPGLQMGRDWVYPREALLGALNRMAEEQAGKRRSRDDAAPSAVLRAIGPTATEPQRGNKPARRPPTLPALG